MGINRVGTNLAYGFNNSLQSIPPSVIFAERDPESDDRAQLGSMWINSDTNTYFVLTSANTWTPQSAGSSSVATLSITGTSGNVLTVASGGNTVLGGDLDVAGAVELSGTVLINNAVTINGSLDIDSSSIVSITTTLNAAPAIQIATDGGPSESIIIVNNQGTGSGSDIVPSIFLGSVAGGVSLFGAKDIRIESAQTGSLAMNLISAGNINLTSARVARIRSTYNAAGSIEINANAGTSETIVIKSSLGTSNSAVDISSVGGGIVINAAKTIAIDSELAINIGTSTSNLQLITIGANNILNQVALRGGSASIDLNNNFVNGVKILSGGVIDILCYGLATAIYLDSDSTGFIRFETGTPSTGAFQFYNSKVTAASLIVTNNAHWGTCTLTGQTITVGSEVDIVINNTSITTTSGISFSVNFIDTSVSGGRITSTGSVQANGSLTIKVKNTGLGNITVTDNIIVTFQVFL